MSKVDAYTLDITKLQLDAIKFLIASRDYDYLHKLQLVGDRNVGKSSIIRRYTEGKLQTTNIDPLHVLSIHKRRWF